MNWLNEQRHLSLLPVCWILSLQRFLKNTVWPAMLNIMNLLVSTGTFAWTFKTAVKEPPATIPGPWSTRGPYRTLPALSKVPDRIEACLTPQSPDEEQLIWTLSVRETTSSTTLTRAISSWLSQNIMWPSKTALLWLDLISQIEPNLFFVKNQNQKAAKTFGLA